MRRFRSQLRRMVKPASMLVVAMLLALSLTVSTSRQAEAAPIAAVAPVIAAAEAIVGGAALPFTMPSLLATSLALHPVGWTIAAVGAVIGVGLWATQDYWLPWAQEVGAGMWGGPKPNTNVPATKGLIDPAVSLSYVGLTAPGQNTTRVKVAIDKSKIPPTGTAYTAFQVSYFMVCRGNKDGTGTNYDKTSWATSDYRHDTGPEVTFDLTCAGGWHLGGIFGTPGADPLLTASVPGSVKGPANVMRWGTLVKMDGGFDTRGADVKYKTTVECLEPNGVKSMITAESFGNEGGVKVPSCAAAGKGHGTGKMTVDGYAPTAPGVPGTAPTPLFDQPAPNVPADHPQKLCDPNRPGDGCKMAITIDGKPCVVGAWDCENWTEIWKDPATAPRVGCTYGPYTIAVDLCTVMEPAYRPGGAPANEPNTDGNPDTRSYTEPGGQTYTPPQTSTGTVPGGAGAPMPGQLALPGATPETPQCWPNGWAMLNPLEWILRPLGCAFVPSANVQAKAEAVTPMFANKAPFVWMGGAGAVVAGGASVSNSCPDWRIEVAGLSENVVCESSFTQAILSSRGALFGLMVIAMFWPLIRSLWYSVIPILRPTPMAS